VDEVRFLNAIGNYFQVPVVAIDAKSIDRQTLALLPSRFVFQHHILPLEVRDNTVVLATYDLFNSIGRQLASQLLKRPVEWVLVPRVQILRAMKTLYGVGAETFDEILKTRGSFDALQDTEASMDLNADDPEASVVKFVNQIIREAIVERATDIHVEPLENDLRIRYRIDGILQTQALPPEINRFQAAIISRIKIMARLNIAEKRLPQDGRIKMRVQNREIDVRLSIIPMVHGEGICMRCGGLMVKEYYLDLQDDTGQIGITGVQTFIFDQRYAVVGAQSPEVLAEAIAEAHGAARPDPEVVNPRPAPQVDKKKDDDSQDPSIRPITPAERAQFGAAVRSTRTGRSLPGANGESYREIVEALLAYDTNAADAIDLLIGQPGYVGITTSGPFTPNTNIGHARQRWLFRMVHSPAPLQEKMALVWHQHFATAFSKISSLVQNSVDATRLMAAKPATDATGQRGQIELFRQYALGDFEDLLVEVAKDPAMLLWLDGYTNTKNMPQENFGRELMELFTFGVAHYVEH
jgi:hypothetical protein